jgi:hypothetical protein
MRKSSECAKMFLSCTKGRHADTPGSRLADKIRKRSYENRAWTGVRMWNHGPHTVVNDNINQTYQLFDDELVSQKPSISWLLLLTELTRPVSIRE